jgi:hypothetical protein
MKAWVVLCAIIFGALPVSAKDDPFVYWALNCQGCHRPDGSGTRGATPPINGEVAKFLNVNGGRSYLARVPGVANAPLSDAILAELLNWMLIRFDQDHLPRNHKPYTDKEVAALRAKGLGVNVMQERARLVAEIERRTTGR